MDERGSPMRDEMGQLVTREKYHPPVWQALAWELERRDPDHYALRSRTDLHLSRGAAEKPRPRLSKADAIDPLNEAVSILVKHGMELPESAGAIETSAAQTTEMGDPTPRTSAR